MNKQLFTTKIAIFVLAFAGQQLLGSTAKPTPPTTQSASTLVTILLDYAVRNTDTEIVSINFDDNEDRATEERIAALTSQLSTMSMRQPATEQRQLRPSQQQVAAETKKVELKEAKQPETMAVTSATDTKQSHAAKTLEFNEETEGLNVFTPSFETEFTLDDVKFPSLATFYISCYGNKLAPKWDDNYNMPLLRRAMHAQILQHQDLLTKLLNTTDNTLVYRSPDKFWGIGSDGKGKNYLGKILMITRTEIRNHQQTVTESKDAKKPQTPTFVSSTNAKLSLATDTLKFDEKTEDLNVFTPSFNAEFILDSVKFPNIAALFLPYKICPYKPYGYEYDVYAQVSLLRRAIRTQILQHPELQENLLNTGNSTLVYQNPDTFLGVNANGKGENYLGKILMVTRFEIRDAMERGKAKYGTKHKLICA